MENVIDKGRLWLLCAHGTDGAMTHVARSLMRTHRVVLDQPGAQIRLDLLDNLVKLGTKGIGQIA